MYPQRRFSFALVGLLLALASLDARAAGNPGTTPAKRTSGTLAPGTKFATPYFIFDSGRPGPTVMVTGGVHGNEPAGAAAAEQIHGWTVSRGRLIVAPRLNIGGLKAGTRRLPDVDESLADLNRDFPHVGKDEPSRGTPAVEIWQFVRQQKPDWLIDLHEALQFRAHGEDSVGNSLLPCPSPDMRKALPGLLAAVNAGISDPQKRFAAARPPKDTTLARAAGTHLPVRAMIIETTQFDQPLSLRTAQHVTIVHQLLEYLEMVDGAAK
jgi:hypothetical protein